MNIKISAVRSPMKDSSVGVTAYISYRMEWFYKNRRSPIPQWRNENRIVIRYA